MDLLENPYSSDIWLVPLTLDDDWNDPAPFAKNADDTDPLFQDDDLGTPVDDVVVTGRRRPSQQGWSGGDYDSSWFDWDGYDTSDPYIPAPPPRPEGWSDCLDRRIDDLTAQAAALLLGLPTYARQEFGFVIWRDAAGDLHLSNRIDGDNNSLTGLNPSTTPSDLGFTSWSQAVGIIHSHPTERQLADGSWITVPTSENHFMPNAGDWAWPDFFVSQGADSANFRQYIMHYNVLGEFNYYQNGPGNGARRTEATNENGECPT